jgi:hypothetical protein
MTATGSISSGGGGGCDDSDIKRSASVIHNHREPSCPAVDSATILTSTTGVDEESGGERSVLSSVITLKSDDCVASSADGDDSRPGRDAEARSEGEKHYTISTPILLQDTNLDEATLLFPADNDSNVSLSQEKIELTVIDGPLARLGGGKTDKPCAVVGGIVAYHTPTSSLGSSLGEIMGEASSLAAHDNDSPTIIDGSSSSNKSITQDQQLSVEGDGASSPDIIPSTDEEFMATSATPIRRKPTLKHSIPSPLSSAATSSLAPPPARSPQPTKSSRIQSNSSHNTEDHPIDNRDADIKDNDDDDGENDIPAHIKSKIVEKSPAERYIRFNEKLGSGAYKDVYRAYDTIEGIEVAWNVVKLSGVPKAERIRIVNEVRLLERLHHPNIISFHGSWVNRETERVIFVTEILSSGTLKSFVQKVQLIRWKIFKRWAIQILNGLAYLHSQDPPIIHRDLKCDNIFINGTSGDLRIGDFGLSTAINQRNQVRWSCCRCTPFLTFLV